MSIADAPVPSGFNSRRAAQVVAYLANKSTTKRLNVVKLIKLVYLADRESIKNFGFPILDDDDRVSMRLGPVNSTTYRYVNGEEISSAWNAILRDRSNHEISVKTAALESGWDELSDADIECLDKTWKTFGHMGPFDLVHWTHDPNNVPEWEDPDGSAYLIPMRRILTALGIEDVDLHNRTIEDHRRLSRLLDSIGN
jgi:uncharacterized phage-associated protein